LERKVSFACHLVTKKQEEDLLLKQKIMARPILLTLLLAASQEQFSTASIFRRYREGGSNGRNLQFDGIDIPGLIPTPNWTNIDWSLPADPQEWNNFNWTDDSWQDFLQNVNQAIDFCPFVELAVGIGQEFGSEGDCTCREAEGGDFFLQVKCGFGNICLDSTLCASADLNFTADQTSGMMNISTCVDSTNTGLEEICFSYTLDTTPDVAQTCEATYGGQSCVCDIENLCLKLDCSAYLPGAKMDTCQILSTEFAIDAESWIPSLDIFDDLFNGTFSFDEVNWDNLDWANVDWDNFNFDLVNWTAMDWPTMTWDSIFGETLLMTEDICPILTEQILKLDDQLAGSCTCNNDAGYNNVLCKFVSQCTADIPDFDGDENDGATAISRTNMNSGLCGDILFDLGFNDGIDSIDTKLCVDFEEDIHPTTCIDFGIPFADTESDPTCTATYGGKACTCSIDKDLCVVVDCSEWEETAIMDTCQKISPVETTEVREMVPKFGIPSAASADEGGTPSAATGDESETVEGGTESELKDSASSGIVFGVVGMMIATLSTFAFIA